MAVCNQKDMVDVGGIFMRTRPKALPSTNITPELIKDLQMTHSYFNGGVLLVTGKNNKGHRIVYVCGDLPLFTVSNIKRLYNLGWSTRLLSFMYDCAMNTILKVIRYKDM